MKDFIIRTLQRPVVAHIWAAQNRYSNRLGREFAAGVAFFSVLALVPIAMLGIAGLGFTLTLLRPDLFDNVKSWINTELANSGFAATISTQLENAFENWRSITIAAVITAAYAGSKWAGNLKRALRVMWLDTFSRAAVKRNFIIDLLENILIFFGLLLMLGIAVALAYLGQGFPEQVANWLGIADVPGIVVLLRIATLLLNLLASWLLMAFIFLVMPGETTKPKIWFAGCLIGAVLLTGLQQLAGILVGVFSGNVATAVFGPTIVVMLMLNVVATIILLVGAWVGTAETWPAFLASQNLPGSKPIVDEQAQDREAARQAAAVDSARTWADRRRRERWAARKSVDELRAINFDPGQVPSPDPDEQVSQDVAVLGVQTGTKVGYSLGAATGLGVGAVVVSLGRRLNRIRSRGQSNPEKTTEV